MELILAFYVNSAEGLDKGAAIEKIVSMPSRERIGRFKYTPENKINSEYTEILAELDSDVDRAVKTSDELYGGETQCLRNINPYARLQARL